MRSNGSAMLWLLYVLCEADIVENLRTALYSRHATVDSIVPDTVGRNATSRIDCGRECTSSTSECHAFYYRVASKSCKLVTKYNYIDFVQAGTQPYDFYHKDDGLVSTSLPWLFCPSGDQVIGLSNDGSKFTFRVINATVSQPDASSACRNAGEKLIKIDTAEKQVHVSNMLSTCPDFLGLDYWIDGYKHTTAGWIYTDGSNIHMNKTHLWDTDAPNDGGPDGNGCIRMRYDKSYRWDDYSCNTIKFGYICEPN